MAKMNRDELASSVAGQLMSLASEDDQLGRGEFRLMSVEPDPYNAQNFVVTVSSWDAEAKVSVFHVCVSRLA